MTVTWPEYRGTTNRQSTASQDGDDATQSADQVYYQSKASYHVYKLQVNYTYTLLMYVINIHYEISLRHIYLTGNMIIIIMKSVTLISYLILYLNT